jgi:hypothetical protein
MQTKPRAKAIPKKLKKAVLKEWMKCMHLLDGTKNLETPKIPAEDVCHCNIKSTNDGMTVCSDCNKPRRPTYTFERTFLKYSGPPDRLR